MVKEDRDRSPEGRFKYLGEKRMTKALLAIESVKKLADRKNYRYEQNQVDYIVSRLEGAVQEVKEEFARQSSAQPIKFSFDD